MRKRKSVEIVEEEELEKRRFEFASGAKFFE